MTIREQLEERERLQLAPAASKSAETRGRLRPEPEDPITATISPSSTRTLTSRSTGTARLPIRYALVMPLSSIMATGLSRPRMPWIEERGPELGRKVLRTWDEERVLAARDRAALRRLRKRLDGVPVIEVPRLDEDVHDLDGLALMNDYLFRRARRSPRGRPSPSRRTG